MTSFPTDALASHASPAALRALIEERRAVRRFRGEQVPEAVGRQAEKGVYNPRLRFPLEEHVTWL